MEDRQPQRADGDDFHFGFFPRDVVGSFSGNNLCSASPDRNSVSRALFLLLGGLWLISPGIAWFVSRTRAPRALPLTADQATSFAGWRGAPGPTLTICRRS
jgi:hypothetical protein